MDRKKRRSALIICAVMAAVSALLLLLPDRFLTQYSLIPREQVRIDTVDNTALYPVGIVYTGAQTCRVTVLTGTYAGESAEAGNYLNSALDKDKLFTAGDVAYAMVQRSEGALRITLIDHYRAGTELWILGALALGLIGFGGVVGSGALVSLAASAVIIWKLLIPLLLDGVNPVLASLVTVLALTAIIDVLVAGFTRRCAVALLGSLAGTATTFLLAVLLTGVLRLDGGDIPYVVPLLAQSSMTVDTRGLFVGMMFIANSGALMDLSMDISVACEEIHRHCPTLAPRELLKSGLTVGRGVLGTMATTLMLAYSGNYLSMLMYFAGQGTPIGDIVNLKYVASQLLNTLVGSFGLVATAPLSALIAAAVYPRGAGRRANVPQRRGVRRLAAPPPAPAEAGAAVP
ncbi:MAG: YibE/F family protein [Clostridiales bacterium]|nr:YibE/F family protein [Clostridiales bacterium]